MSYSFRTSNYGFQLVYYNFQLIRYAFRSVVAAMLLFILFILGRMRYQGFRVFHLGSLCVLMFMFLVGSQGPKDVKLSTWLYDGADLCRSYGKAESWTRLINWVLFSLALFCCIYNA
jgi:hypothetical protein